MKYKREKFSTFIPSSLIFLLILAFFFAGHFLAPPMVHANGKIKIVVKDLKSKGVDELLVGTITELVKEAINKTGKYIVVTSEVGANRLIVGTLEKIGDTYTIELKLIDGERAETINTHVEKIKEALPERVEKAASSLVLEGAINKNIAGQEGPTIRHIPLNKKLGKNNIVIFAAITSAGEVATVDLHYRKSQSKKPFNTVAMQARGEGRYEGLIPKNAVTDVGVEYYFEARDTAGNRSSEGTLAQPHYISVEPEFVKEKRKWWQWVMGVVAIGGVAAALGGGGGSSDSGGGNPGPGTGGISVGW